MVHQNTISEEQLQGSTASSRVIYSGTTKHYIAFTLANISEYSNLAGEFVFLDQSQINALGYASKRAMFYSDTPIVLIVDTQKINGEVISSGGVYKVRSLEVGCFLIYESHLTKQGKFEMIDINNINTLSRLIIKLNKMDVVHCTHRYLEDILQ